MRRRTREYELPEGAHAPEEAAAAIVADFKRRQSVRGYARFEGRRRPTSRVEIYDAGGPEVMAERVAQGALLDRVRSGDAAAVLELRERYHAWIVGREGPA